MANGFVVLREALRLCRRHPGLWLTAALMALPLAAVSAVSGPLERWTLIPEKLREGWPSDLSGVVLWVVELLVQIISAAVVTLAMARVVAGRPTSTRTAWREGLGRIRPAITASLALFLPFTGWGLVIAAPAGVLSAAIRQGHPLLAKAIGFTGIALWLLFTSVRYASVYGVAMVQRIGGFPAISGTVDLQQGRMWLVAGALLPIELARHGLQQLIDLLPSMAAGIGTDVVNWLILPIETAAAVLLYVRFRAERDGLSQQALNEQLSS